MKTLQLKIQIQDIHKPTVWRRVLVPEYITFDELHKIIQAAFGWEDCHLYQFSKNGSSSELIYKIPDEYDDDTVEDSRIAILSEIFTTAKQTFAYIYDLGDNWTHRILLEDILDKKIIVPICTAGKSACPPEDCGGIPGYHNLIEILDNPKDPEHKEMKNWLGLKKNEQWDVNAFDIHRVNGRISQVKIVTRNWQPK